MSAVEEFLHTVTVDGERVTSLYDQWVPQEVITLADDVSCLTFRDEFSGRSAVWYLDGERNYCGSHIEVVQRLRTEDVLGAISPWLDELVRHSLTTTPVSSSPSPVIPEFLAAQLASAWAVRTLRDLRQVQTSLLGRDKTLTLPNGKPVSSRKIRRVLDARVGPETLVILSPFTDLPLRSQMSFVIDHQLIHRFYDSESNSAFYLSWWERQLDQQPVFYSPSHNIIISDHEHSTMLPGVILGWYLSNPDHVITISEAQAFEARDYGLGNTSSLFVDTPQKETLVAPPKETATADMLSESWAFLQQTQSSQPSMETGKGKKTSEQSDSLFGRLRAFVKKKQ